MPGQCCSSPNNRHAIVDVHHDGRLKSSSSSSSTIVRTTVTSHSGDSVTASSDAATHLNRTLFHGTTTHSRNACDCGKHAEASCTDYNTRSVSSPSFSAGILFQNDPELLSDWSVSQQNLSLLPVGTDVSQRPINNVNTRCVDPHHRLVDSVHPQRRSYVNCQDDHVTGSEGEHTTGSESYTPMSQRGQLEFQNLSANPVCDPEQDQEFRNEKEGDEGRRKKTRGTIDSAGMERNLELTIPKVLPCSGDGSPLTDCQQQPPGLPIHQHLPQSPSVYHQNPRSPRSPSDLHPYLPRSPSDQHPHSPRSSCDQHPHSPRSPCDQPPPLRSPENQLSQPIGCLCHKHPQPPISPDHYAQQPGPFAQCQPHVPSFHQPRPPTSPGTQSVSPKYGEDEQIPPTEREVPPKSPHRSQLPSMMNQKFNPRYPTASKRRKKPGESQSSIEMKELPSELLPGDASTNYSPIAGVGVLDPYHPAVSSCHQRHCTAQDYDGADTCGIRADHSELLANSQTKAEGKQTSEFSGPIVEQQEKRDVPANTIQSLSPGATNEQPRLRVHSRTGSLGDEETDAIPIPSPTTLQEIPKSRRRLSVTQNQLLRMNQSDAQSQLPDTTQSELTFEASYHDLNDSALQYIPQPVFEDELENYLTNPDNEYMNSVPPVITGSTDSENSGVPSFQNPDTLQDYTSCA